MKHSGKEAESPVTKRNTRKYAIIIILLISLLVFSYTIYSYSKRPGKYDDFASCLTEKGAIIYGNDFCQYTNKQLNFFGNSDKYLKYVKCIENEELCRSKGVTVTPAWEIDGKMYQQVQTFERLSQLTGCKI